MTTSTEEMSSEQRDKLLNQAYSAAQKDLREAHKEEFDSYRVKRSAELGIEWTPRKSKIELALETIENLLAENPEVTERLIERLAAKTNTPS